MLPQYVVARRAYIEGLREHEEWLVGGESVGVEISIPYPLYGEQMNLPDDLGS